MMKRTNRMSSRRVATGIHASDRFPGVETPGYRHVVATRQTIPNTLNTPAKSTLDFTDENANGVSQPSLGSLSRTLGRGIATATICGTPSGVPQPAAERSLTRSALRDSGLCSETPVGFPSVPTTLRSSMAKARRRNSQTLARPDISSAVIPYSAAIRRSNTC